MNRCYRERVIDPVFLTSADGVRAAGNDLGVGNPFAELT